MLKLLPNVDLPTVAQRSAGAADSAEELIRQLTAGASASLENPSRLHGLRAEAMFRAVLVALGRFELLVEEDEGQLYYDDTRGSVKSPDYRAVDTDGRRLLVEVKGVRPNLKRLRHRISADEMEGLRRYGELTDTPVTVAHYWSAPNLWTLVDLDRMRLRDGQFEIELAEAVRSNQMVRFGDRMVATVPPLELRLEVEELGQRAEPNAATVVIRNAQLSAAGQPLADEVEQRIAFLLFRYGGWEVEMPATVDPAGRVTSFALAAAPPQEVREEVRRQGCAMVGSLSSMYSAIFNEITLDDDGAVRRLDHHSAPGEIGSLIPDDYFKRPDRQLRLWVFEVHPADEGAVS